MKHDYGAKEDGVIGKRYDPKLIRRLIPYVMPYKAFISLSAILVLFLTLLDLCIPYITKIAIDDHIVPIIEFNAKNEAGEGEKKRLLKVHLSDEKVLEVVETYPGLFIRHGDEVKIPYADLVKLPEEALRILRGENLSGLLKVSLFFLIAITLSVVLTFFQKLTMEFTGHKMMHDLRLDLYRHIQSLSVAFFSHRPAAQLVTRMTNDIQKMHDLFTSVISFVFKDIFLLLGIGLVLIWIDLKLALISFAVLPFVVLTAFIFEYYIRDVFRQIKIKVSEINTRFSETILGMKVIQVFQKEESNFKSFQQLNNEKYQWGMKQIQGFAVFMPFIDFLGTIALALVIFFGGRSILSNAMTLGDLVAFITYIKMFFRPIRDLAEKYNILQNAMASAERVFELFDNDEKIKTNGSLRHEVPFENEMQKIKMITFDNVRFSYIPGENVLKDISFKLNAGEKLSIVGPTGSGKSSLIQLLLRFYDPTSGGIFLNDNNLKEMDLAHLRSRIALVTQDPFLFSGTLKDNIQMGRDFIPEDQFEEILNASHLTSIIKRLPDGLYTSILEGGKSLSSGERQLISIARALTRNAEVILLDEATSYIDSQTEHHLKTALENLMADRTAIIVAHRLITAHSTDNILVLNHGKIIEYGGHEVLMKKRGFYYNLNQYMSMPVTGLKERE